MSTVYNSVIQTRDPFENYTIVGIVPEESDQPKANEIFTNGKIASLVTNSKKFSNSAHMIDDRSRV